MYLPSLLQGLLSVILMAGAFVTFLHSTRELSAKHKILIILQLTGNFKHQCNNKVKHRRMLVGIADSFLWIKA